MPDTLQNIPESPTGHSSNTLRQGPGRSQLGPCQPV